MRVSECISLKLRGIECISLKLKGICVILKTWRVLGEFFENRGYLVKKPANILYIHLLTSYIQEAQNHLFFHLSDSKLQLFTLYLCRWSSSTCFHWVRISWENRSLRLPSCSAWPYEVFPCLTCLHLELLSLSYAYISASKNNFKIHAISNMQILNHWKLLIC